MIHTFFIPKTEEEAINRLAEDLQRYNINVNIKKNEDGLDYVALETQKNARYAGRKKIDMVDYDIEHMIKDLETMTAAEVSANWGISKRTMYRRIEEYKKCHN